MEETETAADAPGKSPFGEVRSPRLSVLHLMLWTLCSAVYLSLMRALMSVQGEMPAQYAAYQGASIVVQGIFTGAVVAGAIVLVSARVRSGPPMLRQPGHWLLFVAALFHLAYLPFFLLVLLVQDSEFAGGSILIFAFGALNLVPTIAYGFAAAHNRVIGWKILFIALAIMALAQCIMYASMWLTVGGSSYFIVTLTAIQWVGGLLIPMAVVVLLIVDAAAGRRYDWLHWTGVTTQMAGASLMLLWIIGNWLMG